MRNERARERKLTNVEASCIDGQLSTVFRHVAVWAYEDEFRFLQVVKNVKPPERQRFRYRGSPQAIKARAIAGREQDIDRNRKKVRRYAQECRL